MSVGCSPKEVFERGPQACRMAQGAHDVFDALRKHMLPQLPLQSLLSLRETCRSFQSLVDEHTGPLWRSAAEDLLPTETLPGSTDGYPVIKRLQDHAINLECFASGGPNANSLACPCHKYSAGSRDASVTYESYYDVSVCPRE